MNIEKNRREFLKLSGALCLGALIAPHDLFAMQTSEIYTPADTRSLNFYNVNTLESLDVTYFKNGIYSDEAHAKINELMIDRRSGEITTMELGLIDTLHQIHTLSGSNEPLEIICGYRSPQTNEKLRHQTSGVAKHSYHTLGQAADINIKDILLEELHRIAISLNAGGVGFYPHSGFIHVDIGPVRTWRG